MDQEADKDMSRGEGGVEHNIEVVEENAGKLPSVLMDNSENWVEKIPNHLKMIDLFSIRFLYSLEWLSFPSG